MDSNTVLNSTIGIWMCNNNDTVITNLWGNAARATVVCQIGGTTTTSQLVVNTQGSDGSTISGLYTTLWQGGSMIQSCFSPCTFNVQNGQTKSSSTTLLSTSSTTGATELTMPLRGEAGVT